MTKIRVDQKNIFQKKLIICLSEKICLMPGPLIVPLNKIKIIIVNHQLLRWKRICDLNDKLISRKLLLNYLSFCFLKKIWYNVGRCVSGLSLKNSGLRLARRYFQFFKVQPCNIVFRFQWQNEFWEIKYLNAIGNSEF